MHRKDTVTDQYTAQRTECSYEQDMTAYDSLKFSDNGEISGSHDGKYEDDCLLGWCAV
jgi:hypothetical protein